MPARVDVGKMQIRLKDQQKVLTDQIAAEKKKIQPSLTLNPDHTEMAYDYDYRGRRMSLLGQLEDQLVDINEALERINKGTYGVCTHCGQAIKVERLEALPSAALCIDCQRQKGLR